MSPTTGAPTNGQSTTTPPNDAPQQISSLGAAGGKQLIDLSESFIKDGIYLRAWSKKTVRTYRQGLNAFQMAVGESRQDASPADERIGQPSDASSFHITKAHLDTFVISIRQRGLSAGGCNMYIRTINSFLSWLNAEGVLSEKLRVRLLPNPAKPLRGFSDGEIRSLLSFRPKGFFELRTWTLIQLLLDCGCRIEETLGVSESEIELDNLWLTVHGKGAKLRQVPFSLELRKVIYRYGLFVGLAVQDTKEVLAKLVQVSSAPVRARTSSW